MKKLSLLVLFLSQFSWGQINFLDPYELSITSDIAFAPAKEEIEQMQLSFEAQQWPVEVLKYTLLRLQQNPYIVSGFDIELTIWETNRSRKIVIDVPVSTAYVKAFRTEEGFNERYVDFLSDTYEWILDYL